MLVGSSSVADRYSFHHRARWVIGVGADAERNRAELSDNTNFGVWTVVDEDQIVGSYEVGVISHPDDGVVRGRVSVKCADVRRSRRRRGGKYTHRLSARARMRQHY